MLATLSSLLVPEGGDQVVRMQFLEPFGQDSNALAMEGLATKADATPVATTDLNISRRVDGASGV